jgi:selenium metabolism protein YedF
MAKEIDVRGLPCPRPVISTKKALEEIKEGTITVLVDNPESKENVRRFAISQGCKVKVEEKEDIFHLEITKGRSGEKEEELGTETEKEFDKTMNADVVCITTDRFGTGSEELGEILMKAFLNTLWDYQPRPARLLFINSGVMLTIEGSDVLDTLKLLEKEGVEIFSCSTCLAHYGIKDKLRIGKITNMYEMVDALLTAGKVVNI